MSDAVDVAADWRAHCALIAPPFLLTPIIRLRVQVDADATPTISADRQGVTINPHWWGALTREQRAQIAAHELAHLYAAGALI